MIPAIWLGHRHKGCGMKGRGIEIKDAAVSVEESRTKAVLSLDKGFRRLVGETFRIM